MSWLEVEPPPEPPPEAATKPVAKPRSNRPGPRRPPTLRNAAARRETLEVAPEWLMVDGEAPTGQAPRAAQPAKRPRPAWQPPTLPPPPEATTRKPTRQKAPPIPREDEDEPAGGKKR